MLALEQFLPYRVSRLANLLGKALATLYEKDYDLKPPEWRVMAVLGRTPGIAAAQVTDITAMDKVAVSRAVKRLIAMGRVNAQPDQHDARRILLSLSDSGQAIYEEISPRLLAMEERLLAELGPFVRRNVDQMLSQLTELAQKL